MVQLMSQQYSLCPYSTNMFLEDSLCTQSRVYALTVQFMTLEYSISPHSTFYDPKVQFMSLSTVYVLSVWYILSQ